MRANVPPTTEASVSTASVFATPGTPSSRQWPRASRQTSIRSIIRSWPTMTRLTSNRVRSSCVASCAGVGWATFVLQLSGLSLTGRRYRLQAFQQRPHASRDDAVNTVRVTGSTPSLYCARLAGVGRLENRVEDRLDDWLDETRRAALSALPEWLGVFVQTGSMDGLTAAEAVGAWDALRMRPRVLVDVAEVDTATSVLGAPVATPLLVAPTALHRAVHPDGELATA